MSINPFSFLWPVHSPGHKWIQARVYENQQGESRLRDEPEWVLTEDIAIGDLYHAKRYAPLEEAVGLFRTFADLPGENRDVLLKFANTYGHLGISKANDRVIERNGQLLIGVGGDTWEDWKSEIRAMRLAVEIWTMLQKGDVAALSRHISWEDHKDDGGQSQWVYWTNPQARGTTAQELLSLLSSGEPVSAIGIPPVLDLFRPGDVVIPASFLLQRWINDHLKGAASPQLRYDVKLDKRVIQIIPDSLIAAMWLQLGQAFAGNRKHRPCAECGRWFEVSTEDGGFGINRKFCSDPCKSKDYRDRKEKARRLKDQGKTVAAIAKELDTPSETVKSWTTKRKS